MPICMWSLNSTDTNLSDPTHGATTRHPRVTTASAVTYPLQLASQVDFTVKIGAPGDVTQADLFHGGPNLSRIMVAQRVGGAATIATNGYARGLFRHVLSSNSPEPSSAWGDSFIVNGTQYLYVGNSQFIDTTA
jgi:hypothetical protein